MSITKIKRLLSVFFAIVVCMAIGIYLIAFDQFRYTAVESATPTAVYPIGEIVDGMRIEQKIRINGDYISEIQIYPETYSRENSGILYVQVVDEAGDTVAQASVAVNALTSYQYISIPLEQWEPVVSGEELTLRLYTQGCEYGQAVSIFVDNSKNREDLVNDGLELNDSAIDGNLCVKLNGYKSISFYKTYWFCVAAMLVICGVLAIYWLDRLKKGKPNPLNLIGAVFFQYAFLFKQLIVRDFKTKYKRSALGLAWSFVNPLLTMLVQYIVFSTAFKSDIPNFPVYLLTGVVFFNFFNEAVTLGMTSITNNAALIKKVYVPKYIYPISRVLSSLVNFLCAFIPLLLVMAITRTAFSWACLLLIFDIFCLLMFITGMTLILTTAMTFFQDTQFLWSVVSMMWTYLTPLFYPETIIPEQYLSLYRMNPMYQYIYFARTCILEGVSPEPMTYILCFGFGLLFLFAGMLVFKKNQARFVLYL